MRIAIFSDVHGNLIALEAVIDDIRERGIDLIYCLGDLVDFAPWNNEVIDFVRENNIPCIQGNHDERVGFDLPIIRLAKHTEEEQEAREAAINLTKRTLKADNLIYLQELPFTMRFGFKMGSQIWNIQMMHGGLDRNDTYIYEDESEENLIEMLDRSSSDVLLMGHTHLSFIRRVGSRWVVNCGSIGRSKERSRKASYVILNLTESVFYPELIYVDFDIQGVVDAIRQSEIPDFYAKFWEENNSQ